MTRRLTVLFAGAEALLVLGIGIGIPLLAATVLWAAHFGFAPEWTVFFRASADVWLLGHGVDVRFTLDPDVAAAIGSPGAGEPITITLALLGFAVLTFALAVRAGRRTAEAGHPVLGAAAGIVVFAAASVGIALLSLHDAARVSLVQSAVLPTAVFAVGSAIGTLTARDRRGDRVVVVPGTLPQVPAPVLAGARVAVRVGVGGALAVVATGALLTAIAIAVGYAQLIALYESLQTGVLGGVVLTLAQLALLPVVVLWAASWVVGPGFAVGVGSAISPFTTVVGPIPPIPLLGALPAATPPFAFLVLVIPVVAGFLLGTIAARRARETLRPLLLAASAAAGGIVAGLVLGVLAAAAAGAAGPGRLAVVGPDPLAVGLWAAVLIGVPAALGAAAGAVGAEPWTTARQSV